MQNTSQKNRGASRKNATKPKVPKAKPGKGKAPKTRVVGAASYRDEARTIGLPDLRMHKVSWVTGFVYVGDGTNGATDSVYFRTAGANGGTANNLTPGNSGGGANPVLGSDPNLGQAYVADVEKHYSRKVLRRARLRAVSVQPSTANNMMTCIAPVRGCGASGDTAVFWAATTAAPTLQNTMGMSGAKTCTSYESLELDLTPYIAGGSGAKQDEFSINRDGDTTAANWGGGSIDLAGIAACAFVVAGTNSTAALRGVNTHYVIIDTWCDYLDFLGGMSNPNPIALYLSAEEANRILRLVLTAPEKDLRDLPFCKALVKRLALSGSNSR